MHKFKIYVGAYVDFKFAIEFVELVIIDDTTNNQ